jgi:hypothetical protein
MPAMTMSYVIAIPKEAESLGPGDKISADLVVSNSKARLEKIVLLEKAKPNPSPASSAQARRKLPDVLLRGRVARATLFSEI